jgi:cytochrome c-type biogenesis protein CcmH/NrfG
VADLQTILEQDPSNLECMRQLGLKLQQAGRAREGEKHLLRALEIEPNNPDSHFALAEFYQAQGMKFKAFKHLNIILQLDPQNQRAMDLLGIKKRKGGLYEITRP